MSGLYHRSLQDISMQEKRSRRGSPYSRPSPSSRPSSDDKWQHDRFGDGNTIRDGSRRSNAADSPSQKLLVEGIHYEISNIELENLFQQIGPTEKCFIRYDRSGRSTGTATVIYKQVVHAIEAKREYDGANAKGQPIKITYEVYREFAPRGPSAAAASLGPALTGKSPDLMSRLGGGNLSSRIAGGPPTGERAPFNAPRGPAQSTMNRPGPERTISGETRGRGGVFRGRGGRGRGGRGGSGRGPPPTASNLDAELDAFMKTPSAADKPIDNDVDMS